MRRPSILLVAALVLICIALILAFFLQPEAVDSSVPINVPPPAPLEGAADAGPPIAPPPVETPLDGGLAPPPLRPDAGGTTIPAPPPATAADAGAAPMGLEDIPGAPTGALPGTSAGLDGGTRFPIDREGIREAMRAATPEIKACYEDWVRLQPELTGRMSVRFRVDPRDGEGRVTQIDVGDAGMGHVAFEGCVLSVVSDLRFESPGDGGMTVTYPFTFLTRDAGR